jgi:hypothetical protein
VIRPHSFHYESPNCEYLNVSSTFRPKKAGIVAQEVVALPIEELERFAAEHDADSVDWVISSCYKLIRSVEQIIGDGQKIRGISRDKLARTLKSIADRAFTTGWNTNGLTSIQRAQILDVLLSVADLAEKYSFQHSF